MRLGKREVIVPKEEAVFWMDGNGRWHNKHGQIKSLKIIHYFNQSIRWDDHGFHLFQETDETLEKVYFHHEGTALFVINFRFSEAMELILNTKETIAMDPSKLFLKENDLYYQAQDYQIKFTQNALIKLSKFFHEDDESLILELGSHRVTIPDFQ